MNFSFAVSSDKIFLGKNGECREAKKSGQIDELY